MKSKKWPFNSNVGLSTLGIIVGVMVLILTLVIYDGYVKKMETIIFSLFPQISIKSTSGLLDEDKDDDNEPTFFEPESLFEESHCDEICAGKVVLSDYSADDDAVMQSAHVFKMETLVQIIEKLQPLTALTALNPVILEEGRFKYNDTQEDNFRILGVKTANTVHYVPEIDRIIDEPDVLNQPNTIIISAELYRKLFNNDAPNDAVNQTIRLELQKEEKKFAPVTLKIVGVFKLGIHKIADNMLITSLPTAQTLLNMSGYASMLGISVHEPFGAEPVADSIKDILGKDDNIEDVLVFQWLQVASDLFNSLNLYRNLIIVVLLMSLIITAFNIYNNLAIMILERQRQIGILLAMGIRKGAVYRIFLIISQIEGLLGSFVGIVSGVVMGYWFNIYLNSTLANFLPVQDATITLRTDIVMGIIIFVCFVCALTSFIPAYRASRLDVVETLQSE
jgi:ABC-type lipoprotein release transport system permease subunit